MGVFLALLVGDVVLDLRVLGVALIASLVDGSLSDLGVSRHDEVLCSENLKI